MLALLGKERKQRKQQPKEPAEPVVVSAVPMKRSAGTISATVQSVGDRSALRYALEQFRNEVPKYDIGAVAFSFMSADFIRNSLSVVHCHVAAFEGEETVNSSRMGTIDQTTPCMTCGLVGIDCPGHMGHIELPVPLPHPLALDLIVYVMQSVCSNCGRLLLPAPLREDHTIMRLKGSARLKEIARVISSTNAIACPRNLEMVDRIRGGSVCDDDKFGACSSICLKYSIPKDPDDWKILVSGRDSNKQKFSKPVSIDHVRHVFDAITPNDLTILGFTGDAHPRNFILTAFPVIPERNRPPVERDGEKKYDHITYTYVKIIRECLSIEDYLAKKEKGDPSVENDISSTTRELYFCISHLISNSDGRYKIHKDDAAVTVGSRLSGKEGYCRASAQGKRVNNSGRSVIGPGILPFGSVLLPGVTRVITLPERVNIFNIERIRKQAEQGDIIHLTRGAGPLKGIRMRLPKLMVDAAAKGEPMEPIEIGDLVNRLGMVGDEIILNRQPTLHRHSLIGVKAIYRYDQQTIKLHMSYTTPANADFDG